MSDPVNRGPVWGPWVRFRPAGRTRSEYMQAFSGRWEVWGLVLPAGRKRILTRPHQDQAFARHNKTIPRPLHIIFLKHYPILSQQAIPTLARGFLGFSGMLWEDPVEILGGCLQKLGPGEVWWGSGSAQRAEPDPMLRCQTRWIGVRCGVLGSGSAQRAEPDPNMICKHFQGGMWEVWGLVLSAGRNRILTRPHQDQAFARHNKTIPRPLRIIFLKHYPIYYPSKLSQPLLRKTLIDKISGQESR